MSFPRYPKYKASGVEWLGEVPEEWEVVPIKWLSPVKRGASPRPIDDPKYFDEEGEYAWVRIADVSACDGDLNETTQRLSPLGSSLSVKISPGELFVSIAGTVGKPCIAAIKACIHDGFVYFPTLEIAPRFLYRIFEAGVCYGGLGKWGTQLNLNTDTVGSIRVAVPPADELNQVLEFLDRETEKIDELVAEQRQLMELLKEKRQAVISRAVTKGINPHAPMKPSGIEWLGDVPVGWEVTPVWILFDMGRGRVMSQEEMNQNAGDYPVYSSQTENDGVMGRINTYAFDGDYLTWTTDGANAGTVFRRSGKFSCTNVCGTLKPRVGGLYLDFAWMALSISTESFVRHDINPKLMNNVMAKIRICLPAYEEQVKIANYVTHSVADFDTLTAEAQRAIDFLQERRTALISAAVTGQIDVRDYSKTRGAA